MKKQSDNYDSLRDKIIGLGEKSVRKTFYPELQTNIEELKRFKALLSKVQDAIFIMDPKSGKIEELNTTGTKFFKASPDEISKLMFQELFDEQSSRIITEFLKNNRRKTLSLVAQIEKKYSSLETFVEINLDVNSVDDREYIVAVMRDCTERVRIRKELYSNESNLAAIIENTKDLIWSVDNELKLLIYNSLYSDYVFAFYGVIIEKGMYILDIQSKEELPLWREWYSNALRGRTFSVEVMRSLESGLRIYEVSFNPIRLGSMINGVSVFAKDVTQRKMAERTLEQHRAAMEASIDGMALLGSDEHFIYMNRAHAELFGYDKEELTGASWETLYNNEGIEKFRREILPVLAKTGSWRGETITKRKNGELFTQELSLNLFKEDIYICVSRDIQERIDIQEKIRAAKEMAEKSDKLKTEFLAQMSHEIRTPINAILSFSSLIKESIVEQSDDIIETGFEIISNAGERIIRTVDLILNMSELYVGTYDYKPQKLDLYEDVVRDLFEQFRVMASAKGLKLHLYNRQQGSKLYIDRYSVTQVFENLINNALKYTERGSIVIKLEEDDLTCRVHVEDTGIGISEEYLDTIFEPFSQEEQGYTRKYEGNGLGLALVKKYCEMNRADIKVESKKGKGSCFTVIFKK